MTSRVWWISTEEDIQVLWESLAWANLAPSETRQASEALERLNFSVIQLASMLDEAYSWLTSGTTKYRLEEYGDFLERYRSFKRIQEEGNPIEI